MYLIVEITREVHTKLYSRAALADTQKAFRDYCTADVHPIDDTRLMVCTTIKDDAPDRGMDILLEFWNYWLDRSCQEFLDR